MKYYELIEANRNEKIKVQNNNEYKIHVLANITVEYLKPYLEYALRVEGINADVHIGDYDNIVQESSYAQKKNACVLFWELCNIVEGFHYNSYVLNDKETDLLTSKVISEIDFTLDALKKSPLIIWNKFSVISFEHTSLYKNNLEHMCDVLNRHIESYDLKNLVLVDLNKVIAKVGIDSAVNFRDYYSSKSLYSRQFFDEYVTFIKPAIFSLTGKSKKALIIDCDNTLWNGVLGEDGFENIGMSAKDKENSVFAEIQQYINYLAERGVIIGIASKNNLDDIAEVFERHTDITLKDENIVIKKIHWDSKVSSLVDISKELNIGIDSIVFVDDSSFEVELIRNNLPQVEVFQVPKSKSSYPNMFKKIIPLFFNVDVTSEDKKRNKMYKSQLKRAESQSHFENIEDYLASLGLEIDINIDANENLSRLSQLTQKTNQFNLTTKRYSETEIENYIDSENYQVISMLVSDKYGDSGLAGMAIVEYKENGDVYLDTLLMSCRILGRNIEYALFDQIIKILQENKCKKLIMQYMATPKNSQVKDLYLKFGARIIEQNENITHYELELDEYKYFNIDYIGINYER